MYKRQSESSLTTEEKVTISDTPGLGLKAKEPDFKNQYTGKNAEALTVKKGGGAGETEINAISGATVSYTHLPQRVHI